MQAGLANRAAFGMMGTSFCASLACTMSGSAGNDFHTVLANPAFELDCQSDCLLACKSGWLPEYAQAEGRPKTGAEGALVRAPET